MNPFYLLGLNYHTANVDFRSKIVIDATFREALLAFFPDVFDGFCSIMTCNRTELYFSSVPFSFPVRLESFFVQYFKLDSIDFNACCYRSTDEFYIVKHLFCVASGLDSLVFGESQILGQIKESYQYSKRLGLMPSYFDGLFQKSFQTAKKIRRNTYIGHYGVSVSSLGSKQALSLFDVAEYVDLKVLILGAGSTGSLAAKYFHAQGVRHFFVLNRTAERGSHLAKTIQGQYYPLDSLSRLLPEVDIVVCTLANQKNFISVDLLAAQANSIKSQLVFLDLSMPSNIEQSCADFEHVSLIGLGDLNEISQKHMLERQSDRFKADIIILDEVYAFLKWFQARSFMFHLIDFEADYSSFLDVLPLRIKNGTAILIYDVCFNYLKARCLSFDATFDAVCYDMERYLKIYYVTLDLDAIFSYLKLQMNRLLHSTRLLLRQAIFDRNEDLLLKYSQLLSRSYVK